MPHAREVVYRPAPRRFDMRELSRAATWALVALAAVTLATLAASTPRGEDRLILAVANFRGVPPPERLVRTPAEIQERNQARNEARQLAEAIRHLSEHRMQLLARLDTLERSVGDITSSIRAPKPAAAPPPPEPAPAVAEPAVAEPVVAAPAVAAPVTVPIPSAKPETPAEHQPVPTKAEFGIDLGRASTVEGLRQLWTAAKNRHGAALEGLYPVVTVRELARSGVELRLVAGPMPNAAAAARLCASLPGQPCHPTVFDGQRLALR